MKFKSKLLKKAWEDERFSYFGLTFAVDEAERLIAATPHQARVAPKNFLENFVGKTEVGESMEEEEGLSFNLLETRLDKKHMKGVDHSKPGIVACVTFKPDKRHPEPMTNYILIDGNHRAKKALTLGEDFQVYMLTPRGVMEMLGSGYPSLSAKELCQPDEESSKAEEA